MNKQQGRSNLRNMKGLYEASLVKGHLREESEAPQLAVAS